MNKQTLHPCRVKAFVCQIGSGLLTFLLSAMFLITYSQSKASPDSGYITMHLKDAPIQKAFDIIKQQTSYRVMYDNSLLRQAKPVSISVDREVLTNVLNLLFQAQPFNYRIINENIILTPRKPETGGFSMIQKGQQEIPNDTLIVTGIVVDDSTFLPLEGATVAIKGNSNSTATDKTGKFQISLLNGGTIIISYVGFATQAVSISKVSNQPLLVILHKNINQLEEVTVVNTGYQVVPKERSTGSFEKIDNKTLNQQSSPNILDRLRDVSSGISFDTRQLSAQKRLNVSVRGLSTINGPVDPLIVVDNFIWEGDINNINPNDIDNITILKDAAATSIWGARAANGVIIINTKKTNFNKKIQIEFSANTTIINKPDLYSLSQMSTSDFIEVEEYLFNKGFRLTDTASLNRPPLTPVYEILLKRKANLISSFDSAQLIDKLKTYDSRREYDRYFYQKGIVQQYGLSMRGGGDNIAWLVSGNYNKSAVNLKGRYDKINLRVENAYSPIHTLKITGGIYYTSSKETDGAPVYNSIAVGNKRVPYLSFTDQKGNPVSIDRSLRGGYTDTAGGGKLLDWKYYPLNDWENDKTTNNLRELILNIGLNYSIFNKFQIQINYQHQIQNNVQEHLAGIGSYYTRDLINMFTALGEPSTPPLYQIPTGDIYEVKSVERKSQNFRSQLNYSQSWNNFSINSIAGFEAREVLSGGNYSRLYGYIADPLSFSAVDFHTRLPTFLRGSLSNIPGAPRIDANITNRFVSVYSNTAFAYKQRYTFSLSARKDASNVFGLSTNDKWNPLWSTGLRWATSDEPFYRVKWLPVLRARATLGLGGNIDVSRTPLPISGSLANVVTGYPVRRISTLNNPSLRWEKSKQLNIGLDFSFKNQTISGTIDYYTKRGFDLYGEAPFDYTTWGQSNYLTRNVANISGKGIDASIITKNIDRTIKWGSQILFSFNANKTTAYYTNSSKDISSFLGTSAITPVVGKPLYSIVAYKWGGLNTSGDPQGYLNKELSTDFQNIFNEARNKGIDGGNIVFVGTSSPKYWGSLINEFSWKGFHFSFNVSYKMGYFVVKPSLSYSSLYNFGSSNKEFENRWKQPGDEVNTNVPAMVYTNYPQFSNRDVFYSLSEVNVVKADHIRLQYVNFSYNFSDVLKANIDLLELYINTANLGILWKANKYGIDPEYNNTLAPSKQFTIGVRLNLK